MAKKAKKQSKAKTKNVPMTIAQDIVNILNTKYPDATLVEQSFALHIVNSTITVQMATDSVADILESSITIGEDEVT